MLVPLHFVPARKSGIGQWIRLCVCVNLSIYHARYFDRTWGNDACNFSVLTFSKLHLLRGRKKFWIQCYSLNLLQAEPEHLYNIARKYSHIANCELTSCCNECGAKHREKYASLQLISHYLVRSEGTLQASVCIIHAEFPREKKHFLSFWNLLLPFSIERPTK